MLFDPLAQTIAAYDRVSSQYSDEWFGSSIIQDFFEEFASHLDATSVVLDAGCGSGREIKELVDRHVDSVGIDLSYETVKRARINVPSGFFRVMDIRNLEYPDSLFDGILCIAVLHHLFDRDFKRAISQFIRVAKSKGLIGLTIRLGDGYKTDALGRVIVLREQEDVENTLVSMGLSVIRSRVSHGGEDRRWLQILASNVSKKEARPEPLCGFCSGPLFLKENRLAHAPVAASVLWGDEKFLVTLDVAPLVDGHLLLATHNHLLSTLGTDQDLIRLSFHKRQLDDVLKRAFNRKPVFLEHGSNKDRTERDPCIEHAHIHAIPLQNELRSIVERRIGRLSKIQNISRADAAAKGSEYFSYENKQGAIFLTKRMEQFPSQFMRQVVAEALGFDEYLWVACRDEKRVRNTFDRTLRMLIDVLDNDALSREIISDIPQDIRYKLGSIEENERQDLALSKTGRRVIARLATQNPNVPVEHITLDRLGERQIVQDILVPYFDAGHRGAYYLGDDAAVFPWAGNRILATTDHCPAPMFFALGLKSYQAYGWLSVIISMSDIAAMGGEPKAVLLNTEMPPDMKVLDYISFVEGVSFAASVYGTRVVGGNIREAPSFGAATTVLGSSIQGTDLYRDGAEPG